MSTHETVKEAWSAVSDAGLPEELKETAFREVLRSMLTGSEPVGKPRSNPRRHASGGSAGDGGKSNDGDAVEIDEHEVFAKVEHQTGVSLDKLERLVMVDDGVVKMIPPGKDLGKTTAEAARAAAQVVTVVGAYGLDRRDTEYEVIRNECVRLRVYDSKNFASKHLPNITGFVTKGSGNSRRLEAKAAGAKNFPPLVDYLLGEV